MTQTTDKRTHSAAPWFVARAESAKWDVFSQGTDGAFRLGSFTKEVDARLAASAPDLLAALEMACDAIVDAKLDIQTDIMHTDEDGESYYLCLDEVLADVIAKARGDA